MEDPINIHLPQMCSVLKHLNTLPDVWGLASWGILVGSKYNKAEQAALLACEKGMGGFVVTKQPGIGTPPLSLIDLV